MTLKISHGQYMLIDPFVYPIEFFFFAQLNSPRDLIERATDFSPISFQPPLRLISLS